MKAWSRPRASSETISVSRGVNPYSWTTAATAAAEAFPGVFSPSIAARLIPQPSPTPAPPNSSSALKSTANTAIICTAAAPSAPPIEPRSVPHAMPATRPPTKAHMIQGHTQFAERSLCLITQTASIHERNMMKR